MANSIEQELKDLKRQIHELSTIVKQSIGSMDHVMIQGEGKKIGFDSKRAAKLLSALGHEQRLDLLKSLLAKPMPGTELIQKLKMGTTGQFYHHIKPLIDANLVRQEERGGPYEIVKERLNPLLLLITGVQNMIDATTHMTMNETRTAVASYLGNPSEGGYDPHPLLWAVLENSILEHQAGFCDQVAIFLHEKGSVTVSDNGRGIPAEKLTDANRSMVEEILTNLEEPSTDYKAIDSGKEIGIAVVNALCLHFVVDIQRKGFTYRQSYRNGIPETGLEPVGQTKETGTSVTLNPNPMLFRDTFDANVIRDHLDKIQEEFPHLEIVFKGVEEYDL